MPAPENHEDAVHEPLAVAKARFIESLEHEPQLHKLFQEATIENMISSATDIEREDYKSGARSLGCRLQPFVTAVTDLAEGYDTLARALLERIEIPKAVADDIQHIYHHGSRSPDAEEVLKILSAITMEFENVTFVIDGLDEMEERDRFCISRSLKELLITRKKTTRLFITSRDNPAFTFTTVSSTEFREQASLEALATDIDAFVRHSVWALLDVGSLKLLDSELEETIVNTLVHGAKGM